ncbi:hypothetical protein Tco_0320055 [Tanacetum coccineum]
MNTTQAQQKALDDALVALADRLEFGKYNMRLKTDIKPKEATFQVVLDPLALTPFYQAFLITTEICPNIPGQRFEDLPLEQDIISFIRDLGHSGDITYLTDGMLHKKNIDYVYLLWEDFLYHIENKEVKKTNKMSYPRFTKIVIDYFMSKDQSISRRNKMFWHTARDDTMFTTIRCVSRHEKTQVYGTILLKEFTNQTMLESQAYKTYYAYASGEKTPKPKYVRKKVDSDSSPKKKPAQATKGTRLKTSAKVAKSDKKKQLAKMPKTKGLAVLSEVALTEAEQLKLATERRKIQLHISHASGSSDGVDTQSKVPDEQQQKVSGTNEGAGVEETESDNDGDDLTHLNLPTYKADDKEEEEEKVDDEEMSSDQRVSTPPDYELTNEEENKEGVDKSDAKMTDAQANHDMKDSHVILNPVPLVVQQQSSSVSSDLVSKFINPSPDTVDVAVQIQTNKLREEAQAENQEFLNQVDSTMKAIIKEQVQAQVSKIMPQIENYATESLGAEDVLRSSSFTVRIPVEEDSH